MRSSNLSNISIYFLCSFFLPISWWFDSKILSLPAASQLFQFSDDYNCKKETIIFFIHNPRPLCSADADGSPNSESTVGTSRNAYELSGTSWCCWLLCEGWYSFPCIAISISTFLVHALGPYRITSEALIAAFHDVQIIHSNSNSFESWMRCTKIVRTIHRRADESCVPLISFMTHHGVICNEEVSLVQDFVSSIASFELYLFFNSRRKYEWKIPPWRTPGIQFLRLVLLPGSNTLLLLRESMASRLLICDSALALVDTKSRNPAWLHQHSLRQRPYTPPSPMQPRPRMWQATEAQRPQKLASQDVLLPRSGSLCLPIRHLLIRWPSSIDSLSFWMLRCHGAVWEPLLLRHKRRSWQPLGTRPKTELVDVTLFVYFELPCSFPLLPLHEKTAGDAPIAASSYPGAWCKHLSWLVDVIVKMNREDTLFKDHIILGTNPKCTIILQAVDFFAFPQVLRNKWPHFAQPQ